ncbi:hypothetical protein HZ992_18800 [Rhizobacter sp. AJA081-3]|uniref:hypothetical protein n=1 Tax=Rhizobacter sp. AJA081-3 TaxID=2753607 RepID=UPI001ADFEEAE|nr:hypothetical protein [Rhizobacter sp. AJA081-3]QTN22190.1 hypothetical protein HZ992_18800 [Rhizobacter sp. AJA081-3]
MVPKLKPRLILIEDDDGRIKAFQRWLEGTEFVLVVARSGGQAMGMLLQGAKGVAGVLLDHDLSDALLTTTDSMLSASHLVPLIQRSVPRWVPVLIHSHNMSKPAVMQRSLESAGFSVTRARFALLEREPARFARWLEDVRDCWESEED